MNAKPNFDVSFACVNEDTGKFHWYSYRKTMTFGYALFLADRFSSDSDDVKVTPLNDAAFREYDKG